MGNEASLEGGEGLPEGLAPDGKGGFVRVPGGDPVDLSELSEEQRKQLEVAMARAQGRQPGGAARRPSQGDVQQRSQQVGASRGSTGLSKSRTIDAFNQGPVGKPPPGRSPSSLSLFESRFRQEPKSAESKSSGMFGSSFLSGANPLSAMTSSVSSSLSSMGDAVTIPKFGIFGDEEEGDTPAKGPQQQGPKCPQQGGPQKPPGQGPKQAQGPTGQGPKPGQGPTGQGPKQAQGPPGQQGPKTGPGPPGPGAKQGGPPQQKGAAPSPQGAGPKQQGPSGPGGQPGPAKSVGPAAQQGAGKPVPCPLCKTTQMNVGAKEPPNYNNCTECKNEVCSLCGFSPPDSAGKEWLCLNCQMQRAMGGMDPPNPKQGSAPPSPQKQSPGKPGNLLIKQQSHQSDQGLTPPTTPRQKSPGPTSSGPPSPGSSISGSPKIDPKTGKPIMQKSSPQQSPSKAKQESSFFGGFGLGGLTDSVKSATTSSQSESVTGKLFGGFGGLMETSKPQAQTAPKQEESVAGKLFSGFGGSSDSSSKPPAAASQMFSFGSSLLSSASNLVTGEDSKPAEPSRSPPQSPADSGPGSPPDSGPGSPPDSPFSPPGSPPDTDSAPDTPPAKLTKPTKSMSVDKEEKPASTTPKQSCPLCNIELNVGSSDTPNYSLCTECKKTVCNLCGFNPTPHLGEKEWLCLNCQMQRAMSGQLGDVPPPAMVSPKKQSPAPASVAPTSTTPPAPAGPPTPAAPASVDSQPVVEPADLNPAAPEAKVEDPIPPILDNASVTSPSDSIPHQEIPQDQTDAYIPGNVPELPPVMQKQNSLDREKGGPKPETDTEPYVPVSVVAGNQEDKNTLIQSISEESEKLNLLSKTEIDKTTAFSETQPNPEISQSEAPSDKQEEASPTQDALLDEMAKTAVDPLVTPSECNNAADVIEQQETQVVENGSSTSIDLSQPKAHCENIVENKKGCDPQTEIITKIKPDIGNTQPTSLGQAAAEVKDGNLINEIGSHPKTEDITENKSDIETVIEKGQRCIENKGIESIIEQALATENPTEDIVTEVKPGEENIVEVTPGNNSAVKEDVVKMETIKQSAIESPVVMDKSHDGKVFEQEEVMAEGSAQVKVEEVVKNRGTVINEELCTNLSLTKTEDNIVVTEESNRNVAQANTHFEENLGTSEQTGPSYLNEEDVTNTKEPLPSEDKIQVSAITSEAVKSEISQEDPGQSNTNIVAESQHEVSYDPSTLTGTDEKQDEKVAEQKVSVTEQERDFGTNVVESQPVAKNLKISISDTGTAGEKDTAAECKIEYSTISQAEQNQSVFQLDSTPPLAKPDIPDSVVCSSLDKSNQEEKTEESSVKPSEEDTAEVTVL